jgi:hypothetical protein
VPASEVVEGEEPKPAAPGSEWDDLAHVRTEIEAEVAEVNAAHKEAYAALVASGTDKFVAADSLDSALRGALQGVYAKYAPGKYAA